jgi:putative Mn2+ efflux pump MntP
MAILGQEVLFPALVIGIVCFAFTACGIHLGRIVRALAGNWGSFANIFGGLVLIAIGLSILRDHGVFA